MSAKHTPAPWIVIPGERPSVQRGMEGGFCVYGKSRDREEADANLIAAAPDLLEALESILDGVDDSDQGDGYCEPVEILCWKIREAKSAIKKARGDA